MLFRQQRDGMCIIEAASEEQSEKLQQLADTGNENLPIKKNETLNVCHGTIVVPNNIETGETQFSECHTKIKENLKVQGYDVKNVITYLKAARGNRTYPLRVAKITFDGRVLPDTVIIAGQRLSIREYIPTPRQCEKCWKYGHSIKYCKAELYTCPICSKKGHQKNDCMPNNSKMCVNCQDNHPSFSKSCAVFKKEQLIVKTRFKEGLSYRAAVNKLKQTGEISSLNYKKALERKKPTGSSTPKMSKPSETNRFNILQIEEEPQSNISLDHISQVSPKRMAKRIRESSSEEGGLSPKLNQKRKPKTKNRSCNMHDIVAEVHVDEVTSLDDTIIYADLDHNELNIEAEAASLPTSVPSESTSSTVLPPKSSSFDILPSETSLPTVVSSEAASPSGVPSKACLPSVAPSELPVPTAAHSEPPILTVTPSESPLPFAAISELPVPTAAHSEPPIPTLAPSKSHLPTSTPSATHLTTVTPSKLPLLKKSRPIKVANINIRNNVKLNASQGQPKDPRKMGASGKSEPYPNKIKNLIRDYHMPPGFGDGK